MIERNKGLLILAESINPRQAVAAEVTSMDYYSR